MQWKLSAGIAQTVSETTRIRLDFMEFYPHA